MISSNQWATNCCRPPPSPVGLIYLGWA